MRLAGRHLLPAVIAAGLLGSGCGADRDAPTERMPAEPQIPAEPPAASIPPEIARLRALVTIRVEHPDAEPASYEIICEASLSALQGVVDLDSDEACHALADRAVQRRLIEGPDPDRACAQVYGGPETAIVRGHINGMPVEVSIDRRDACGISDWDELLGDLLIAPRTTR